MDVSFPFCKNRKHESKLGPLIHLHSHFSKALKAAALLMFQELLWTETKIKRRGSDTTSILFKKRIRKEELHCLLHLNYSLLLKEMQLEGVVSADSVWGRCVNGMFLSKHPSKHFFIRVAGCCQMCSLGYIACERKDRGWFSSFFGCTGSN